MTLSRLLTTLSLLITLLFTLSLQNLHAAAGDPDPLDVSINGMVQTTVLQPDGKILVGGAFTSVQGVTRNRIARFNPDGTLDKGFNPNANNTVESIVVQADGKIILGGLFTTLQPDAAAPAVTRNRIARLNADGSLDTGFDPNANADVLSIAEQADGKIVVVGKFTSLRPNGATTAITRLRIARLNSDGTPDTTFTAALNGGDGAYTLAIQADGKILVAGYFASASGASRGNIARLNANGTLDTTFVANANAPVHSIAVQADGKILAGGEFTAVANSARTYIARLNSNGTSDTGFNPSANNRVYSIVPQADGRILISGHFTTLKPIGSASPVPRNFIARLEPNGTLDMSFDPKANTHVNSVALQEDGAILLAGSFTTLQPNGSGAPVARTRFARLQNDPATRTLAVPTGNQASLTSGGSSPEFVRVSFQLSTDSGATWTSLGAGSRLPSSGTWKIYDLPLPSTGLIRALGFTSDANGSTGGIIATVAGFDNPPALPGIAVFTGSGTVSTDERSDNYGTQLLGPTAQTFTIRNTGLADLTNLSLSLSGANPGDFTISALGATVLPPGATTSFTATFLPTALGPRSAVVSVSSNHPDGSPFRINLGNLLPEVAVSGGNGVNIPDGSVTPSLSDQTDFGNISLFGRDSTLTRGFIINNRGAVDLKIGGVTISGEHAADFTISQQPAQTVAAAGSTGFTITFDPSALGLRGAVVSFETNDGDETPFNFNIQGTGFVSNNANLDSLWTEPATLAPSFSATTTSYTASVSFGDAALIIRPGVAEANASTSYSLNGGSFISFPAGSYDPSIPLDVGPNTVILRVTAQDGTTKDHTISVTRAPARPGDLDPLVSNFGVGNVNAIVVQPDGKTIIAGNFMSVQGEWRGCIVRLNADGGLDASFDPQLGGGINCLALQADGKILIGGGFDRLRYDGSSEPFPHRIARLNPDGSLDTGFLPVPDGSVLSLALQPDGKILLGGEFTSIQPHGEAASVLRNRIARLNPDGSLDPVFDPQPDHPVYCVAVQADGKILLGGQFIKLQPNGAATPVSRYFIARVNADGTLDNGFDPGSFLYVYTIAVQKDGKVLYGGYNGISRVQPDGTSDTTFSPNANGSVRSIAVQSDGKVLFGGEFYTVRPAPSGSAAINRRGIARMNGDGTLDTGFDPGAGREVSSIALQADGQVLLGGKFSTFQPNGTSFPITREGFARILNEPATESLTIPSADRIEWLRDGSSPEVEPVTFEYSSDSGASYAPLGVGTRINGGWELTGLTIPSGQIRARGRVAGGMVEAVTAYGISAAPEIQISGNGVNISNGATTTSGDNTDFGNVLLFGTGSTLTRSFTIANTGAAGLALGPVSIAGANPADFTISRQPVSPVPAGRSTTFAITFDPTAVGDRNAVVSFGNNDSDENPTSFSIHGTGFISNNADLANLSINAGGVMTPEFSPAITGYVINVPYGDDTVGVGPDRAELNATIEARMNGGDYNPLESSTLSDSMPINVGANTLEVRVTAQDGTTKTYIVTINRAPLGAGDLSPLNVYTDGGAVNAIAVQPDGSTIIAGGFSAVLGVPRGGIARINPDGTLDTGFVPNMSGHIYTMVLQDDGKVVIGGELYSSDDRKCILRLNADGTLDNSFDPNPNNIVYAMSIQPGGRILLGGIFTTLQPNGAAAATTRNRIARINSDGTLDTTFDPNANDYVTSVAVEPDGKILIGGGFTTLQPNGAASATARQYIARLNADGTLDDGFDPKPNNYVVTLATQPDGKILIGGGFSTLQPNGSASTTTRNKLARLHSDGSLDTGFNPNPNARIQSISLQADGKILVGGEFSTFQPNGGDTYVYRYYSALLNTDGSVSHGFDPHTDTSVSGVALQADGQVLLGGEFLTIQPNGSVKPVYRIRFARILNSPATQTLSTPDATSVSWTRGDSSPEVSQVTFELSTDGGVSYTSLGNPTRVGSTPDWQLDGLNLPTGGLLRARGRTTGGYSNGSSGLVESVISFGTASTPLAAWRQTQFGSPANTGNGADNADPDHDGLANLIEYAFGLEPKSPDASQLPQPLLVGENLTATFIPPAGAEGITYGAQWSENLTDWQPATDMNTAPQRTFTVPMADRKKLYMRLTVTAQ